MIALGLTVGVSACAQPASTSSDRVASDRGDTQSIEAYISAFRADAEREAERFDDVYQDFSVTAEDARTLTYTYVFRDQLDPSEARNNMDAVKDSLSAFAEVIFEEMETYGVVGPVVKWAYLNADGSEIVTYTFAR